MKDPIEVERMLEAAHLGETLEAADRRQLEEASRDSGPNALRMRDLRRFEEILSETLDVAEFHDDVAARVLDRVTRRTSYNLRRPFADSLAKRVLDDALQKGRITPRSARRGLRWPTFGQWIRLGFAVLIVWAIWVWFTRDVAHFEPLQYSPGDLSSRPSRTGPPSGTILAQILYGEPSGLEKLGDTAPREQFGEVAEGDELFTTSAEGAILKVPQSGRVLVAPSSRVVVSRGPRPNTVRVKILQGTVRAANFQRKPLYIQGFDGGDAEVLGEVELTLVAPPTLPVRVTAPDALLVRADKRGQVTLSENNVRIGGGETGLLTGRSLIRLFGAAMVSFPEGTPVWNLAQASGVDIGELRVGDELLNGPQLAAELLRVFSAELAEMIIRSAVVQMELSDASLSVSELVRHEAREIVRLDALYRMAPLRSQEAFDERVHQVAGLLMLARSESSGIRPLNRAQPGAEIEASWHRLAGQVGVEWPDDKATWFVRILYRNRTLEIGVEQAWRDLQRFLRVREVDVAVEDLVRRETARRFLRSIAKEYPKYDPGTGLEPWRRAALATAVRLEGLTWAQFCDRVTLNSVVLANLPAAGTDQVDRLLNEGKAAFRDVTFEHYFFPAAEAVQGLSVVGGTKAPETSRMLAEDVVRLRETGVGPRSFAAGAQGPYRSGIESGPRPWWRDVYGDEFVRAALSLPEGRVSDPIRGPEGWHVLFILRSVEPRLESVFSDLHSRWFVAQRAVSEFLGSLQRGLTVDVPTAASILGRG